MLSQETIGVRVSKRVLWVSDEAYPLNNIARAQTLEIPPQRVAELGSYLKSVAGWAFLGAVASAALTIAGSGGFVPYFAVWAVVAAVIGFKTLQLALIFRNGAYYALIIETSGTPRRVLVSTEEPIVMGLVNSIMEAIDNPQAEFQAWVTNYQFGDKIFQFGDKNVGKSGK